MKRRNFLEVILGALAALPLMGAQSGFQFDDSRKETRNVVITYPEGVRYFHIDPGKSYRLYHDGKNARLEALPPVDDSFYRGELSSLVVYEDSPTPIGVGWESADLEVPMGADIVCADGETRRRIG